MIDRALVQTHLPAVFVFDPDTGQLVSRNATAVAWLANAGDSASERMTLSMVERLLIAGGRAVTLPGASESGDDNHELRRRCRRPDGTELALTRVWGPGSNTILIAADITESVREDRQLRFAQAVIDRLMKSTTLGGALDVLLHIVSLYSGWPYAEAWLPRSGRLTRKAARVWPCTKESDAESGTSGTAAEAWRSGQIIYRAKSDSPGETHGHVAIPLKANDETIAVLVFGFERSHPRDQLTLEVLDGVSERLGMALKCRVSGEEAKSARRQLDELLATAGDAIVATDSAYRITVFNKQAERIFGYTADEIIGQPLDVLLPPEARTRHKAQMVRFGTSGESTKHMAARPEVRGRRKDGLEFPAEASVSRMSVDNEVTYTAVVRDLTSLRKAEEALQAREMQLRMIVEAMPFGVAVIRQGDGEILFSNGALSALVEAGLTGTTGRNIGEFMDNEMVAALSGGSSADGKVTGIEARIRTDSGNIVWCSLSAVEMSMAGEEVTLIGCYDVTDRHRAVSALRESAYNLAEAERIAHLGNWIWNITTNALHWSDEAYRIFGLEPQSLEMTYPVFLNAVHPEDRAFVEQAVLQALENGEPYRIEHRIVMPDGSIRVVREQAEIERDAAGEPVRMRGTVLDTTIINHVTENLRDALNRAELANQAKSQFLANMSHELRTPLNAIIGFSELMAGDVLGPLEVSQYRSYAKDINDSGNHLLAVVNDILDLSRIEVGAAELDECVLDVDNVASACLRTVDGRAVQTGLSLERDIPSVFPTLLADERLLKQILLNLLSNAIKFTPAGGTVRLMGRLDAEGCVILEVADNGIGIAATDIERVMEPFAQVEGSLSRRFDGVGLGLALVKQFARLHDATLAIDSEPGRGTRVTIRFPATRTGAGADSTAMLQRAANGG